MDTLPDLRDTERHSLINEEGGLFNGPDLSSPETWRKLVFYGVVLIMVGTVTFFPIAVAGFWLATFSVVLKRWSRPDEDPPLH